MNTYKAKGKIVLCEDNPSYSLDNAEQAKHLKTLLNSMSETMHHQSSEIELLRDKVSRLESAGDSLWAYLQNHNGFTPEGRTLMTLEWIKAKMVKGIK